MPDFEGSRGWGQGESELCVELSPNLLKTYSPPTKTV